ncbi:hypothetical protein R1flu_006566 [Riccia fluitans]|uniref:Uncharacterized protein n=1 Tax=Riccia fluitans TaxID=41844 RepID=A0ABD1YWC6_9MARC
MGKSESKEANPLGLSCESCKRRSSFHPSYGAFWGLGIGLGCGVGWGPGFGPDVIGYAGGGCGLGFNVGVTLIGFGLGFPATGLTLLPYKFFLWTSKDTHRKAGVHVIPTLIFSAHQYLNTLIFRGLAIRTNLQHISEKVIAMKDLSDGRRLHDNLLQNVVRCVEEIKRMKHFRTARNRSYKLHVREVRSLKDVLEDKPFDQVAAGRQENRENHGRVRLEYVVGLGDCCGKVRGSYARLFLDRRGSGVVLSRRKLLCGSHDLRGNATGCCPIAGQLGRQSFCLKEVWISSMGTESRGRQRSQKKSALLDVMERSFLDNSGR